MNFYEFRDQDERRLDDELEALAHAVIGAAITAAYILRLLALAFFGPFNERWASLKDTTRLETAGALLLIAFIVFMGVWPSPFVDRISATVSTIPGVT